ncbi:MAG: hypothetical protein QXU18_04605, partial [Thermoplasmatales archaeon]
AFMRQVRKDADVDSPSAEFLRKKMIEEANMKYHTIAEQGKLDLSNFKSAFRALKDNAQIHRELTKEFEKTLLLAFNLNEVPDLIDTSSQINWQDVLLYGIEDATFEELLSDIRENIQSETLDGGNDLSESQSTKNKTMPPTSTTPTISKSMANNNRLLKQGSKERNRMSEYENNT